MNEISETLDILYGDGIPMHGAKVDQDEAVRIVQDRYPYAGYPRCQASCRLS